MKLNWELNEETQRVCKKYPICLGDDGPAKQYEQLFINSIERVALSGRI